MQVLTVSVQLLFDVVVKVTLYTPAAVYVLLPFVAVVAAEPSPQFQLYVKVPVAIVLALVYVYALPVKHWFLLFTLKLGDAWGVTINVLLTVSLHPLAVVIVKITLYVPAAEYV